jgi:hypothetical protein
MVIFAKFEGIATKKICQLGDIRSSILKGCSEMFAPLLKFIFNLSSFFSTQTFPAAWEKKGSQYSDL